MKFLFLGLSAVILVVGAISGVAEGNVWIGLIRGVAECIGLYVVMSILASVLPGKE